MFLSNEVRGEKIWNGKVFFLRFIMLPVTPSLNVSTPTALFFFLVVGSVLKGVIYRRARVSKLVNLDSPAGASDVQRFSLSLLKTTIGWISHSKTFKTLQKYTENPLKNLLKPPKTSRKTRERVLVVSSNVRRRRGRS